MRKYLYLIWISFQQLFEYRMDLAWRLAGTAIWTPVLYLFWLAILGTGFGADKYNAYSLGLYYIAISFIDFFTNFDVQVVAQDIQEGVLATSLVKPYNYFGQVFLSLIAEKAVHLTLFAILYLVLLSLGMKQGISFVGLLLALASLFLATAMRFFFSAAIGSLAFWFKRVYGFNALFNNVGGLFSGYLIPVNLLPVTMAAVANYMPFKYMFYVPASLFIQTPDFQGVVRLFFAHIFWLLFSFFLLQFIWRLGIKEFEANGQ